MTLFILTETSAGYALLKAKDKKLLKRDDLAKESETAEGVCSMLKLKQFRKFESASSALEEAAALTEGKVTPMLSNMLSDLKDEKKVSLAVADPKLGNAITKLPGLQISPVSDSTTADLYRSIRTHLSSLIPGLMPEEIGTMSLGLSHSLSRHKLKFSPDKVDTMIIQAIALLDDLDKELNTYAMRVKEWYGWHFPEMARIINDNLAYSRIILKVGMRTKCSTTDLSDILPEEIEGAVKAAAEVSMGTEITEEDLENIQALAEQVVGFTEYRAQLSSYLSARMQAIAPNLTALVGELVGARLIAHAGSLMNLAKSPASTVQILGAEKALFRALKTKHDTPKYGLIYHASLIGQASGKNKGKIARMLATKATLGLRVDALSEWGTAGEGDVKDEPTEEEKSTVGVQGRAMLERRLRALEGKPLKPVGVAIGPQGQKVQQGGVQPGKFDLKEARKYNPDADGISPDAAPAAPAVTNGEASSSKKRKLVEELDDEHEVKKPSKKKVVAEPDPSSSAASDGEGEGDGKVINETHLNGTAERGSKIDEKKEAKAQRKAEKAQRKAEKEAKKQAKAGADGKKEKRKAEADGDEDGERKKKKSKKVRA
ncbi:Nucleolar protein 58 [Vermiconidia calcicola]|uniref:Nucleolar protein 58 n=1 Tax=Vermiconidia calcicola TaxID=1690605 RepID=A0ACC3N1T4_9PEZI|nr:Nucleolar protein 58 [Vermiconidia calcicola]